MKKFRFITLVLSAALVFSLCSCDAAGKKDSGNKGGNGTASFSGTDSDDSLQELRQIIQNDGCMLGALYIGYIEGENTTLSDNRDVYEALFVKNQSYDRFPFLKDFPADQFIRTPMGHELYLMIPADSKATVKINQLELGEEGINVCDTLYTATSGEPFLLQCNYSDLFSDAEVVIKGSDGETLKWSPFMSLKDGRLQTDVENVRKVHDFTEYADSEDDSEE